MTLHVSDWHSDILTISKFIVGDTPHLVASEPLSRNIYIFRWNERYLRLWTYDINKQSIFGGLLPQIILSVALKQELPVKVKGTLWQTYKVQCSMCKTSKVRRLFMGKAEEHQCSVTAFPAFLCCYWGSTAVLLGTNEALFNMRCEWHSSGTLITRTWDAIDMRAVDTLSNFFFFLKCIFYMRSHFKYWVEVVLVVWNRSATTVLLFVLRNDILWYWTTYPINEAVIVIMCQSLSCHCSG